jgi:hypothetical protein
MQGSVPFTLACRNGLIDVVIFLYENGADYSVVDEFHLKTKALELLLKKVPALEALERVSSSDKGKKTIIVASLF